MSSQEKTLHAWRAFTDCKLAFDRLEISEDSIDWRIYWVASVALLRTIGHVLRNVDSANAVDKVVIDQWWNSLKKNTTDGKIFFDFIEQERNAILKEYRFGVDRTPGYIVTENGEQITTEDGSPIMTEQDFFLIEDGAFEGEDGRDIINDALEWWEAQLQHIEKEKIR